MEAESVKTGRGVWVIIIAMVVAIAMAAVATQISFDEDDCGGT